MSIENQQNLEQTKEVVFQSWLVEFKGRFWLNPDTMPEGVYDALQTFIHFDAHQRVREEATQKIKEATANFKKLTGYDIYDFIRYQDEQNEKLKTDKK